MNKPVANYYYDAWGKLLGITDANGNEITASNHVAMLNPIRYRGYFYDTETGFYYLNSRYYDPQIGRFINADDVNILDIDQGSFLQYNLYAYCLNNPVNMVDISGYFAIWIFSKIVSFGKTLITKTASFLIKSKISLLGSIVLTGFGYKLAKGMFNHAIWGKGKEISASLNDLLVSRLNSSSIMNDILATILSRASGTTLRMYITGIEFKNGINKINDDLYYSLQHVSASLTGWKYKGVWNLTITVYDQYNFDNFRTYSGLSLGSLANDLGYVMQSLGMMVPYDICVSYQKRW